MRINLGKKEIKKRYIGLFYGLFVVLFFGICLILIFGSKNVAADGTGNYPAPDSGDWIIENETIVLNETIILKGNLNIENGGNLTFKNVTLLIDCHDNRYVIEVKKMGRFYIYDNDNNNKTTNDRTIISSLSKEYMFYIRKDGKMIMKNSELRNCGYDESNEGLTIFSNHVEIDHNRIIQNRVGIVCKNSNPIISNNTFDENFIGIFCDQSNATILNNTIVNKNIDEGNGISCRFGNPTIAFNTISNLNEGIYCYESNATITHNIIKNIGYGLMETTDGIVCVGGNTIISYNNISNCELNGLECVSGNFLISENLFSNIGHCIIIRNSKTTLINNIISENYKSMQLYDSSVTISETHIINNKIGIKCDNSEVIIINSTILDTREEDFTLEKCNLTLLNCTFEGNVFFWDEESKIIVKWYLSIEVLNKSHNAIQKADVRIQDNENGTYNKTYYTNSEGRIKWINLSEYIHNKTNKTSYSPYTIQAEKDDIWYETILDSNENKAIIIILEDYNIYNGNLSGFVKDHFNNFIEGVKIKIEYHDTFQETFTDKNGYYSISNIPICFCLKKIITLKEGYKNFTTEIGISENSTLNITLFEEENNGKLTGYVKDILNNVLENVKIKIKYHDTFQETFTDENGYYLISNIPICRCLKQVTASKEVYKDFTTEIGIDENTILNITLFGEEKNGKLTGIVTDTFNNTLENVKIRIEYHEIFLETFTDKNGYYSFSNIPICFCLKKVSASKDGHFNFEKNISVSENTILNIMLEPILIPKPDLIITPNYISFSPTSPIEGEKIRIYATIKNIGNTDAKANVTFYLNKISPNNQIGSKQPISVLAGKTDDVYVDWICIPGEYKIYVEITDSNPEEYDISNNIAYKTIKVQKKITDPDLTLTSLDIWIEGTLKVKETVKIKARIHNLGEIEALVTINIFDGKPKEDESNLIGFSTITLQPNSNYTVTEDWTPLTVGNHTIFVIIENSDPQESKTDNNQATRNVYVESTNRKEKSYIPTIAVGTTIGIIALFGFFIAGTEIGLYKLLIVFFLPLYLKITRKDIEKRLSEDKFTVGRIFGYIEAYPGATYSEIKKSMGLNNGTTAYHLNKLEKTDFIKSRRNGRYKHFYSSKIKVPNEEFKLSQVQQTILRKIEEKPGISQIELASSVGISKQLVNYHIRVLSTVEPPFIKMEKNGRKVKCFLSLDEDEIENGKDDFLDDKNK